MISDTQKYLETTNIAETIPVAMMLLNEFLFRDIQIHQSGVDRRTVQYEYWLLSLGL